MSSEALHRLFTLADEALAASPADALECYLQALEIAPEHYMARFNAAVLHARLGFPERAAEQLDQAVGAAPNPDLQREMREIFWSSWAAPLQHTDADFIDFTQPSTAPTRASGASTLKASGLFTAHDLAAASAAPDASAHTGGLYCPHCNATVPTPDANFCPECGHKKPEHPFSWYYDPLLGAQLLQGALRIDEKLDWSGAGVVYGGVDLRVSPAEEASAERAIKLVDLAALADLPGLVQDLDALARLQHPNHVRMYLRGVLPGTERFALVMERLRGKSLPTITENREPMGLDLAIDVLTQLAEALAAAHEIGVLHLSLKPGSVFLLRTDDPAHLHAKLLNLGRTQRLDPLASLTGASRVVEDAEFTAPEQLDAETTPDARTDLYRLGAVAFYALTGRAPWPAPRQGDHAHILEAQRARRGQPGPSPTPLRPDIAWAPGLSELIAQLLATDPDMRPASALEVARRLYAIARERAAQPDPTSTLSAHRPVEPAAAMNTAPIKLGALRRYNEMHALVQARIAHARTLTAPGEAASTWLDIARLAHTELHDPRLAADAFNTALDLNPAFLQAFKELTLLHGEAQNWSGLRADYLRMLERLDGAADPDPRLRVVLHQKLAELCRLHLHDDATAIEHLRTAARLAPNTPTLRRQLADALAHTATDDDLRPLDEAIDALTELLTPSPRQPDVLAELGLLQLRARRFDAALCTFRALELLGGADERALHFVRAHASPVVQPPRQPLPVDLQRRMLFDPGHDDQLASVLALSAEALAELLGSEYDAVGITKKDRIDLQQPLLFSRLFTIAASLLGFPTPPRVFRSRTGRGFVNGLLTPPAFLAGPDVLSGSGEKEVMATIAKQLFLFQAPSYLVQTRPGTDLEVIFYTLALTVRPTLPIALRDGMQAVQRAFLALQRDNAEAGRQVHALITAILGRKDRLDIARIQDDFEDAGNRVALLFADDLRVVTDMLRHEPRPIRPERALDDRIDALLRYSVNPRYHALRKRLGVAIG